VIGSAALYRLAVVVGCMPLGFAEDAIAKEMGLFGEEGSSATFETAQVQFR
jgi:hypothetical protein